MIEVMNQRFKQHAVSSSSQSVDEAMVLFKGRIRFKQLNNFSTDQDKKQLEKDFYRIQFPLNMASNIMVHRAQDQTMADYLVSIDLELQNRDMKVPPEISSLLYVACTCFTQLANLFISLIHPCAWQKTLTKCR